MADVTSINNKTTGAATTSTSAASKLTGGQTLDKDAFLKLLVTQLKYQDPTKPMEDTQFISQMAQFSSLEQMTNVKQGLDNLTQMQSANQALGLVGKSIKLRNPADESNPITGTVSGVKFSANGTRLVVSDKDYALADVISAQ
jgi:flagellar basal-body rod modification protein FlgD